jgi:predicted nucleotidyltransferase
MESTNEYIQMLRMFMHERGAEYEISRIGFFGSIARGEQTKDSDIDIVYESITMNLWDDIALWQDLEAFFGRHVDVVSMHQSMNPLFKQRIEKEAIYV